MNPEKIAILGGGNIGRALAGGLLRHGTRAEQIMVGEASEPARATLAREFGLASSADNAIAVAHATLIVIALKPQDIAAALVPLASVLQRDQPLVISVAAGIGTIALERWCGTGVCVVRAMPNRAALVGAGATAMFAGTLAQDADRKRAESTMRAVGDVVWVASEDALDVVTALSGSGPAYYFLLTEAMTQAAVELGLEGDAARRLALGTLRGAGLLAQEGDGDMARLRHEVTSTGGTTEAALQVLEEAGFKRLIGRAIEAATRRSRDLAARFGGNP